MSFDDLELRKIEQRRRELGTVQMPFDDLLSSLKRGPFGDALARPMYYDREGNPVDLAAWTVIMDREAFLRHRFIARDRLPDGREVSTVFLGLDHAVFGPPLIFETMVFNRPPGGGGEDMWRYSTEQQARAGHRWAVGYCRARPYWRGILREFQLAWRDATRAA